MSKILQSKYVKVRKKRVCFGCGRQFPVGTSMRMDAIADGGIVWNCYLCDTCDEIADGFEYGDEFGFMDLRDDALELERNREMEATG